MVRAEEYLLPEDHSECDLQCGESLAIAANHRLDEGYSLIERFGVWTLRDFRKRPRPRLEKSGRPLFGSIPLHRVRIARHPRAALVPLRSLYRVACVPLVALSCRSKIR